VDFGYLFANCLQRPAFRSTDKGEPKPAGRTHSREAISLAVSEITYRSGHSLRQLQGSPRIPPKRSPGLAIARRLGLQVVFVDTHWEIFGQIEQAMKDLEAGRITAVMKVAPVAAWLRAKAPICASWRESQTTRGHSESGSGKSAGAAGCREGRTRADAARRESEPTQEEVERTVSFDCYRSPCF
jgi:hypothetical protein